MKGQHYCGLTLHWDYSNGHVDVSMPGYIHKVLDKYQLPSLKYPQYAPHTWIPPSYGNKRQYAPCDDTTTFLSKKETKLIQQIVGSLLYYSRAVDPTMMVALNDIGAKQATPTQLTLTQCQMLLDYARTYPNAVLRFKRSDMILHVDSDAAYLVQPNARSRIAGYYFLSSYPPSPPATPKPEINAPILVECKTIRHVVASSAEAETGGLFINAQNIIPIRQALEALGHRQPATPLKTDNSTACNFVHKNMKQRRSKSWDMRYNWLRDKETQQLVRIFWEKGCLNDADYFTKHHSPKYHKSIRSRYILQANNIMKKNIMYHRNIMRGRGCVGDTISLSQKPAHIARPNGQTDRKPMTSRINKKTVKWSNPLSTVIN